MDNLRAEVKGRVEELVRGHEHRVHGVKQELNEKLVEIYTLKDNYHKHVEDAQLHATALA